MCIIIAKPRGKNIPSKETLAICQKNNPHGIGISFRHSNNNYINIVKGFKNHNELYEYLDKHDIRENYDLLIHFRYATVGDRSMENCHPFPITKDRREMRKLKLTCDMAVAHNGTFSEYKNEAKYSDSQTFIKEILSDNSVKKNLFDRTLQELILDYIGNNKLAIMHSEGVIMMGEFENDNGIRYSNKSYKDEWYRFDQTYFNNCCNGSTNNNLALTYRGGDYCQFCYAQKVSTSKITLEGIQYNACDKCAIDLEINQYRGSCRSQCNTCGRMFDNKSLHSRSQFIHNTSIGEYSICLDCLEKEEEYLYKCAL